MKTISSDSSRGRSLMAAIFVLVAFLTGGMLAAPAQAAIVYLGASSAGNDNLPTDGSAGALIIPAPAGVTAGRALIASIAARPRSMTVTVPPGWFLMTSTQQTAGGVSTAPGGMNLLTYYKIATTSEPASYTWTFANPSLGQGGSAVGGILLFSGIDTAGGSPINVWSERLTASGTTHATTSITPTMTNTMIVSSISYLSAGNFANPTGIAGITERLDVSAPVTTNAIGTTLQMSTAPWATATATGASQAVANGNADTGVGHLMALKPSLIDLDISMVRSGPLVPGGTASYTMSVINNGINSEPGPLIIVTTLPAGLSHTTYSGTGWVCAAPSGQNRTCTRTGAIGAGATAPDLVINVSVSTGAIGTLTTTATVSGTGGDGNTANNTAVDSYTLTRDLTITKARTGALNPGQNGTYTLDVSNIGQLTEPGPITVTDVLPAQLTFVSGTGTGWNPCTAAGQTVTCTRPGSLAGATAAATVTLTVAVSQTASAVSNTASVAGTGADSDSTNNSSTDSYSMSADLSLTKVRGGPLVPGSNATYTLTVTNAGPNTSPHPITVTDTLPGGLSFVSGTGTNWTCNAAGQDVTCTRNATLASGATSPITLTVAVSAGASGTIVNSATVSGSATDATPGNDTGSDSYTIPPPPLSAYAYFAMDEASWPASPATNQVIDSSGNNRHANTLGNITTLATPASAPKGDTCRGTDIPKNSTTAAIEAVDTKIDINDLGNAGTISFWYRARLGWNSGGGGTNDRTLFDATNDAGTGEFWLGLQDSGQLRFRLDNAGNSRQTVDTAAFGSIGPNTWAHVAVTWNFTSNTMCVYVNGALANCRNNTAVTSTPNYSTLYVGDNRGPFTNNILIGNSADGSIDELRLYNIDMTAAQITADMNAAHSCIAFDHIRIVHDGEGLTCNPESVTVEACANAGCTSLYAGSVTTTLSPAGWVGGDTITFSGGSTSKQLRKTTVGSVTLGAGSTTPAPGGATTCSDTVASSTSCSLSFVDSGFIFDVPTITACKTLGTIDVTAVKKSDTSTLCVPAFDSGTRTVKFWSTYVSPATGTNQVRVNGNLVDTASPGTDIDLTFGAGAKTTITVNYPDAGQLTLNASYTGSGTENNLVMTGNDTFVSVPVGLAVYSTSSCAAGDASCPVFGKAGNAFDLTVKAACWVVDGDTDLSDNPATPNFRLTGIPLTHAVVAPAPADGGVPGTLGVASFDFAAADNGVKTVSQTVSEVGVFTFTATPGTYLGETVAAATSPYIGRFTPDHFDVTTTAACGPIGTKFDYSGQPFSVTVTAKNLAGGPTGTTQNYDDFGVGKVFSKSTTISNAGVTTNFTNNSIAAASFASGIANQANVTYTFPPLPDPPGKDVVPVTLALRAIDTETVSSAGFVEETAVIRSGRVRLINAYGSELGDLPMPMRVEYYSSDGWVANTDDNCSAVTLNAFSNFQGALTAADTCVQENPAAGCGVSGRGCGGVEPLGQCYRQYQSGGGYNLNFRKPAGEKNGSMDVSADLSAKPWLRYDWDENGSLDNPSARATFGLFRGSPRHIYKRERY